MQSSTPPARELLLEQRVSQLQQQLASAELRAELEKRCSDAAERQLRDAIRGHSKSPSVSSVASHRFPPYMHSQRGPAHTNGLHTATPCTVTGPRHRATDQHMHTAHNPSTTPPSISREASSRMDAAPASMRSVRHAPSTHALFSDSSSEGDTASSPPSSTHQQPPTSAIPPSTSTTQPPRHHAPPKLGVPTFTSPYAPARPPARHPHTSTATAAPTSSRSAGTPALTGWRAAADMATGAYESLYLGGVPVGGVRPLGPLDGSPEASGHPPGPRSSQGPEGIRMGYASPLLGATPRGVPPPSSTRSMPRGPTVNSWVTPGPIGALSQEASAVSPSPSPPSGNSGSSYSPDQLAQPDQQWPPPQQQQQAWRRQQQRAQEGRHQRGQVHHQDPRVQIQTQQGHLQQLAHHHQLLQAQDLQLLASSAKEVLQLRTAFEQLRAQLGMLKNRAPSEPTSGHGSPPEKKAMGWAGQPGESRASGDPGAGPSSTAGHLREGHGDGPATDSNGCLHGGDSKQGEEGSDARHQQQLEAAERQLGELQAQVCDLLSSRSELQAFKSSLHVEVEALQAHCAGLEAQLGEQVALSGRWQEVASEATRAAEEGREALRVAGEQAREMGQRVAEAEAKVMYQRLEFEVAGEEAGEKVRRLEQQREEAEARVRELEEVLGREREEREGGGKRSEEEVRQLGERCETLERACGELEARLKESEAAKKGLEERCAQLNALDLELEEELQLASHARESGVASFQRQLSAQRQERDCAVLHAERQLLLISEERVTEAERFERRLQQLTAERDAEAEKRRASLQEAAERHEAEREAQAARFQARLREMTQQREAAALEFQTQLGQLAERRDADVAQFREACRQLEAARQQVAAQAAAAQAKVATQAEALREREKQIEGGLHREQRVAEQADALREALERARVSEQELAGRCQEARAQAARAREAAAREAERSAAACAALQACMEELQGVLREASDGATLRGGSPGPPEQQQQRQQQQQLTAGCAQGHSVADGTGDSADGTAGDEARDSVPYAASGRRGDASAASALHAVRAACRRAGASAEDLCSALAEEQHQHQCLQRDLSLLQEEIRRQACTHEASVAELRGQMKEQAAAGEALVASLQGRLKKQAGAHDAMVSELQARLRDQAVAHEVEMQRQVQQAAEVEERLGALQQAQRQLEHVQVAMQQLRQQLQQQLEDDALQHQQQLAQALQRAREEQEQALDVLRRQHADELQAALQQQQQRQRALSDAAARGGEVIAKAQAVAEDSLRRQRERTEDAERRSTEAERQWRVAELRCEALEQRLKGLEQQLAECRGRLEESEGAQRRVAPYEGLVDFLVAEGNAGLLERCCRELDRGGQGQGREQGWQGVSGRRPEGGEGCKAGQGSEGSSGTGPGVGCEESGEGRCGETWEEWAAAALCVLGGMACECSELRRQAEEYQQLLQGLEELLACKSVLLQAAAGASGMGAHGAANPRGEGPEAGGAKRDEAGGVGEGENGTLQSSEALAPRHAGASGAESSASPFLQLATLVWQGSFPEPAGPIASALSAAASRLGSDAAAAALLKAHSFSRLRQSHTASSASGTAPTTRQPSGRPSVDGAVLPPLPPVSIRRGSGDGAVDGGGRAGGDRAGLAGEGVEDGLRGSEDERYEALMRRYQALARQYEALQRFQLLGAPSRPLSHPSLAPDLASGHVPTGSTPRQASLQRPASPLAVASSSGAWALGSWQAGGTAAASGAGGGSWLRPRMSSSSLRRNRSWSSQRSADSFHTCVESLATAASSDGAGFGAVEEELKLLRGRMQEMGVLRGRVQELQQQLAAAEELAELAKAQVVTLTVTVQDSQDQQRPGQHSAAEKGAYPEGAAQQPQRLFSGLRNNDPASVPCHMSGSGPKGVAVAADVVYADGTEPTCRPPATVAAAAAAGTSAAVAVAPYEAVDVGYGDMLPGVCPGQFEGQAHPGAGLGPELPSPGKQQYQQLGAVGPSQAVHQIVANLCGTCSRCKELQGMVLELGMQEGRQRQRVDQLGRLIAMLASRLRGALGQYEEAQAGAVGAAEASAAVVWKQLEVWRGAEDEQTR